MTSLTLREHDVLALMAAGCSNAAICRALWISGKTLETHIGRIFAKLGLASDPKHHRRVLAVLRFLDAPPVATTTPSAHGTARVALSVGAGPAGYAGASPRR